MKKAFLTIVALLAVTSVHAQRNGCIRPTNMTRADNTNVIPEPFDFDPQRTYRQPVVLIAFSDVDFSMDSPAVYYNRLFNETGFNEGAGPGCVADYFREQSAGRLNLQFDIYGPVKVDEKAKSTSVINYGNKAISQAIQILRTSSDADFSVYDWNGDGSAEQVLFVCAGHSGNDTSGYIWPNSGSFSQKLPGDIDSFFSSVSCELWANGSLCGIGTIVHEFCHCLGLPDIYPLTPAKNYSTVDEWDLMDGGNYTNRGWCPPSLTAMERMYLGWDMPEELTKPTSITGMKPLGEGGKTYIVRSSSTADEFYLLENRRQEGWDYGCPGNGLLIYHVDFDKDAWLYNRVNVSDTHYRYDLFHADGKDYLFWDPANDGKDLNRWTMPDHLRSRYLSTSPYPYTDPVSLEVYASLTDETTPAATLFAPAADGRPFMGKAITNIRVEADGTVSFDFMKDADRVVTPTTPKDETETWYTLDGCRLQGRPSTKGMYICRTGFTTRFCILH